MRICKIGQKKVPGGKRGKGEGGKPLNLPGVAIPVTKPVMLQAAVKRL